MGVFCQLQLVIHFPAHINKIIITSDRVFMCLVGPGGSRKTRLMFAKLASAITLFPNLQENYYFYKEYQPNFKELAEEFFIEFVACLDFEMVKKLANCFQVFDDSCEQIYLDKKFVKIAVARTHKKIHCISSNIMFLQSKCSRVIDLNATHVVL